MLRRRLPPLCWKPCLLSHLLAVGTAGCLKLRQTSWTGPYRLPWGQQDHAALKYAHHKLTQSKEKLEGAYAEVCACRGVGLECFFYFWLVTPRGGDGWVQPDTLPLLPHPGDIGQWVLLKGYPYLFRTDAAIFSGRLKLIPQNCGP